MELTKNDILFLEAVQRETDTRLNSTDKKTIKANRLLLSDNLLKFFKVDNLAHGFYAFGVYVELDAGFTTQDAKEWQ